MEMNSIIPNDETQRQYYFMEKAKKQVAQLTDVLGRTPTFCVTTFGCQMNFKTVTAQTA